MEELGALLKTRREKRNLSLREVENATSIRTSYLEAIEEGDTSKLISPVYAQGFIKQYANFLGMDGEQLLNESGNFLPKPDKQVFDYGIGTLEPRGNSGTSFKNLNTAIWALCFGGVLLAAWYLAKFLGILGS